MNQEGGLRQCYLIDDDDVDVDDDDGRQLTGV